VLALSMSPIIFAPRDEVFTFLNADGALPQAG